jgi:U3 small nucleolar RNA-associated protein 15
MYTPVLGQSPLIDSLFLRLQKNVSMELRFQQELLKTRGALDMLFASAALVGVDASNPVSEI